MSQPTGHILPELISEALAEELRLEFPRFTGATFADEQVIEQGRAFRTLAGEIGSESFLQRAAELTGIDELIHDPGFRGGGLRAARDGALPGWWHGRHPRGLWPRVGVVVNLTPEWKEPWVNGQSAEAARIALVLTDGVLPDAVPLVAEPAPGRPCLAVLATLYTRDPPHLEDLPALPEPVRTTLELPSSYGRDPAAFESDLAALRELVDARGAALARTLEREAALAARVMSVVERPFWDGTGPFSPAEIAATRAVLDLREGWLSRFAQLEVEYQAAAREVGASPHPPITGPAQVERVAGYFRDRWVTSVFELVLVPSSDISRLRIRGYVSPEVGGRQRLIARIGNASYRTAAASGELVWELAHHMPAGEKVSIVISASHQWIPNHDGSSTDSRPLAWLLSGVEVE